MPAVSRHIFFMRGSHDFGCGVAAERLMQVPFTTIVGFLFLALLVDLSFKYLFCHANAVRIFVQLPGGFKVVIIPGSRANPNAGCARSTLNMRLVVFSI